MATKAIQVELLLGGIMDEGDVALAGGKVYTYGAGTLTDKPTWTDRDKTTLATNPIILDPAGKALVFADGVYKFVIKDASDVTIPTGGTLNNLEFGQTYTGTFNLSKGADIASASALAPGNDGNYFDVTGTTAITSINSVGVGTVIKLHFDSALTLTHHATNLILPGEANITTAAGDEAEFIEYAAGKWICTKYQKINGEAIAYSSAIVTLTGVQTLTDKTLTSPTITSPTITSPTITSPVINTSVSGTAFLDEDDMASDSATKMASQQSIKSYVDNKIGGSGEPAIVKAWVNFNGTGTVAIRNSFNVSSITDNGVGDYTVNLASPMANANYVILGMVSSNSGANPAAVASLRNGTTPTVSAYNLHTGTTNVPVDETYVMSAVFGD